MIAIDTLDRWNRVLEDNLGRVRGADERRALKDVADEIRDAYLAALRAETDRPQGCQR